MSKSSNLTPKNMYTTMQITKKQAQEIMAMADVKRLPAKGKAIIIAFPKGNVFQINAAFHQTIKIANINGNFQLSPI